MKNLTLWCCLFVLAALSFTACTPKDVFPQNGDVIEQSATYEDFVKMDKTPELHTVDFDKVSPLSKDPDAKNNVCSVCAPQIYSISVYNLG